jgi:hypothetical protein
MRLSIKSLKEAFLTECNRASNMQLGRAFFQNFEIAHFLSAAYMQCVNDRIRLFDERYIPSDKRLQEQVDKTPFPSSMRTLLDFGTLYTSTGLLPASKVTIDKLDVATVGENSKIFEIPAIIPYAEASDRAKTWADSTVECPYFVNVSILEYDSSDARIASFLCRPINPVDVTRMSMFYQDDKYMPYIYYRIRPILSNETQTGKFPLKFYIELSYKERDSNSRTFLIADMIRWPHPFTELEMMSEPADKFLDVMFGYEIAQRAAGLAMESIGSSRGQSLQRMSSESAPQ